LPVKAEIGHNVLLLYGVHSGVLESKIFRANAHKDVAYHWKAYTF